MLRFSKHPFHKIGLHVGRRGTFLLFLTLLDFVYGYCLAYPTSQSIGTPVYIFLGSIMPIKIWGALWVAAGVGCLVGALTHRIELGYAVGIFIKTLWAVTFLLGWMFSGVERGYLSAVIWGAFACFLVLIARWPEPEVQLK